MGKCDLCGGRAGLLKSRHQVCEANATALKKNLRGIVYEGTLAGQLFQELNTQAETTIRESNLATRFFRPAMLEAVNEAAMELSQKAPISQNELTRLVDLLKGFGFPEGNRDAILQNGLYGMAFAEMSNTLYEVQNERQPYYDGAGRISFNLRRGEQPIFRAGKVTFAEKGTINTGSRTFGGLSVPVGEGAYYHIGGSQGRKVSGLMPLDIGEMLITWQALYFSGQTRTMRISLAHVLRYEPYVDGVGVYEAAEPPRVFVPDYSGMDTGWFFFNLLSTLTSKSCSN